MSRSGVEEKPAWRAVPRVVRAEAEEALGAPIARSARIWGGYGPSATFRLRLADGRRAFFKGVNATSNDVMRRALVSEEHFYREVVGLVAPWAPAFYGAFRHDDWHVLLLEDLGPASVPPWTAGKARAAAHGYAEFHRATLGRDIASDLARDAHVRFGVMWRHLVSEPSGLESLAALAGPEAGVASAWLRGALPKLQASAELIEQVSSPHALLHFDTRSDNLRVTDGQLRLFDWPYASVGPAEFDVVGFAQSITCEGGPDPETIVAWYRERLPLRDGALDASIAAVAGYFAARSWQPAIPGLPRVRSIQRRQLRSSLAWAARRFHLSEPTWLAQVPP